MYEVGGGGEAGGGIETKVSIGKQPYIVASVSLAAVLFNITICCVNLDPFPVQHLCGCFTYVPYYVDSDGRCCANNETDQHTLQGIPLEKKLKNILRAMHMSVR